MRRVWTKTAFFLMAAGIAAAAAAGDLTIVSKVTPAKGDPTTSTHYITAERMRM